MPLPDPVGHVVDVHARPWSTELASDVRVVEIDPPAAGGRRQEARSGGSVAFVLPNPGPAVDQIEYVYFMRDGKTYRVEGLPLGYRPISDVAWASPRYLVFDRWSQPHYGMHYVVDVERRELVHATPFPDAFFLQQQAK